MHPYTSNPCHSVEFDLNILWFVYFLKEEYYIIIFIIIILVWSIWHIRKLRTCTGNFRKKVAQVTCASAAWYSYNCNYKWIWMIWISRQGPWLGHHTDGKSAGGFIFRRTHHLTLEPYLLTLCGLMTTCLILTNPGLPLNCERSVCRSFSVCKNISSFMGATVRLGDFSLEGWIRHFLKSFFQWVTKTKWRSG